MHRRHGQQRRNGRVVGVNGAVGKNNNLKTVFDGIFGVATDAVEGAFQSFAALVGAEIGINGFALKMRFIHPTQFVKFLNGQNGLFQFNLAAMLRRLREQVFGCPHKRNQRHNGAFSNGVNGRVGYLGKKLFEIVRKVLALLRQNR